jgi:hypothetical protein
VFGEVLAQKCFHKAADCSAALPQDLCGQPAGSAAFFGGFCQYQKVSCSGRFGGLKWQIGLKK